MGAREFHFCKSNCHNFVETLIHLDIKVYFLSQKNHDWSIKSNTQGKAAKRVNSFYRHCRVLIYYYFIWLWFQAYTCELCQINFRVGFWQISNFDSDPQGGQRILTGSLQKVMSLLVLIHSEKIRYDLSFAFWINRKLPVHVFYRLLFLASLCLGWMFCLLCGLRWQVIT